MLGEAEKRQERTVEGQCEYQTVIRALKVPGKVLLHHTWIIQGSISLHHLPLSIDQKLGEIPLDTISKEASPVGLLLQPLPQRVSTGPVHINLTKHVEPSIVRFCKLLDLSFIARLLVPKLV